MADIEEIRRRLQALDTGGPREYVEFGSQAPIDISTLLSELDKRDELLRECMEYVKHGRDCIQNHRVSNGLGLELPTCNCGLDELLRRMDG